MSELQKSEQVDDVPLAARRFVYAFLAVLVVCALVGIEAWPFSAFKLFSARRDGERVSWQIVAVDEAGSESTVHLAELPVGYRNTTTLLGEFDDLSSVERDEVCHAWAAPRRQAGASVDHLRIYRKRTPLGGEARPSVRELMWECGR